MSFIARNPRLLTKLSPAPTRLQQIHNHLQRSVSTPIQPLRKMSASIPKTMKGVLIEKTGGVEVLDHRTDLPVPTPKENELLIKNNIIGINYIDTYFRSGLYPSEKPEILGREAEGTVVSIGPNTTSHFKVGQRVVWMSTSAYAEYTAVPTRTVFAVPEKLAPGIAAAGLLQGLTTVTLVEEAHKVQKGDWVLVHAAAGGVGQWLVQVIKAKGAHTIATASTEEKRELARKLGADVAVGYEHDELLEAVKKATGGAGVAAVYDGVGKDTFDTSLEAVARKGTVVSFGNASGPVPPFPIAKLSAKNSRVCRPTLFNYLVTEEERERYSKEVFELIEAAHINVNIHKTYPLSEVRQAHTDLEGRKTTGKLMLDPSK